MSGPIVNEISLANFNPLSYRFPVLSIEKGVSVLCTQSTALKFALSGSPMIMAGIS